MSGLFFFYINFYIVKDLTASGGSSMVGMIAAALMFLTQIVALPVYLKMIKKYSKAFTYRFGAFIWIIAALGLFCSGKRKSYCHLYICRRYGFWY